MFFFITKMTDKIEETVLDKTLGLNNPETDVLTHYRFNTSMVLIVSDLNKAQIYQMSYRNSSNNEIEILIKFEYLNVFQLNEQTNVYHIRETNDGNFLLEIGDEKYIFVGEKVFSFETNDIIVQHSLDLGFNDINFLYAYGIENI